MDKSELRTQLRDARRSLNSSENKINSQAIVSLLSPLIEHFKTIGIYLPKKEEVDVTQLLRIKGKQFVVPVVESEDVMNMYLYTNKQDLGVGAYEIKEPTTRTLVDKNDIDVLIIPILGFDENLHRIGQGGGYYDRYLENFKGVKIGVAFEIQKTDNIPVDEHDQDMNYIVSEAHVYRKM